MRAVEVPSRLVYPWVMVLVLAFLCRGDAAASDRVDVVDIASWGPRSGLPQSTVTGIASTPDGSLWLSTFGGLARFDGQRAHPVPTEEESLGKVSRLGAMAVDPMDPMIQISGRNWSQKRCITLIIKYFQSARCCPAN